MILRREGDAFLKFPIVNTSIASSTSGCTIKNRGILGDYNESLLLTVVGRMIA